MYMFLYSAIKIKTVPAKEEIYSRLRRQNRHRGLWPLAFKSYMGHFVKYKPSLKLGGLEEKTHGYFSW